MENMETYAKVIKQGNSLVLPMTKDLKKLGLKEGDWVHISLETSSFRTYTPPDEFDPAVIGDRLITSLKVNDRWTDSEIMELIRFYDSDKSHRESILRYMRDRLRNNHGEIA